MSVGTLRKALTKLESQGLLRRVQGSGNYVEAAGIRENVYALFRLELLDGGGLPTAHVISVDHLPKPDDLPSFGTANHGTRIRRLRFLDAEAIAIEEIWLDAGVGVIDQSALTQSLYQTYKTELGVWVSRIEDRVTIGTVPDWSPDAFEPTSGSLSGFVERFSWADMASPIEFSRTWFDTSRAAYVQRLA